MEYILIGFCAAFASMLTFFSGFGLGTILTPVFVLFFPIDVAIALTGVVHLLNNVFKIILVGKYINVRVMLRFGIPAVLGAFVGAKALLYFSGTSPLFSYKLFGYTLTVTPVNLVIAILMILFALFEVIPRLKKIQFGENRLAIGGLVSGFFGGLSGHQGALRSAFLIKIGLTKEAFIATGISIACFVDITRLSVYYTQLANVGIKENLPLLLVAVLSAFAGALVGRQLLTKVTLGFVQAIVAIMIILLSILLGSGII